MALPDGSTFIDIDLTQVDKKSPVDDILMTSIAEDLYYVKNNTSSAGGVFEFKVNGSLSTISTLLPFRRIDGAFVMSATTFSKYGVFLEIPGLSGTLEIDMRKYRAPDTPIIAIDYQYQQNINSITRAGTSTNTQSITAATPQVATQSIAFWKAAINISSIIYLGNNLWRYNLATAPDADWQAGDYILVASATSGGNNGTFQIVRTNDDGIPNIIISNSAGVAQTGSAGNILLQAMSYIITNPANAQFTIGEKARFASHTSGNNNGDFAIYQVNQGANNIIIKNQIGITQGGVAGTIDCLRWAYNFSSSAPADLVAGENGLFAAHTTSGNNGVLPIKAINLSGNNVIVYNTAGALQGGVAGTVDSNRWVYALPTDPATSFVVGNTFRAANTTTLANSGLFTVVQVDRSATNNLVIYNENGVTQAGAVGTLTHTRRLIKFSSDQSAIYSTASRIGMRGVPDGFYNMGFEFTVLEVNRGGGANFNIVINNDSGSSQVSPAGEITIESRSIFSTRPTITTLKDLQISSNGVLDAIEKVVAANRMLCLEILQLPSGSPENLTVHVA